MLLPKKDPFGQAIQDYYTNPSQNRIIEVESNLTEDEQIPVAWLFRSEEDLPPFEQMALDLCAGKVLDLGAGSGVHALILQRRNFEVTAVDISPLAVEVMQNIGIKRAFSANLLDFESEKFDTMLLLMNGIGVVRTLEGLHRFLEKAKNYLNPKGQIICDSSDILYMFEEEDGSVLLDLNANYYGEMTYQCTYQNVTSDEFNWLYIDFLTLSDIAKQHGFSAEMLAQNEYNSYLARLALS